MPHWDGIRRNGRFGSSLVFFRCFFFLFSSFFSVIDLGSATNGDFVRRKSISIDQTETKLTEDTMIDAPMLYLMSDCAFVALWYSPLSTCLWGDCFTQNKTALLFHYRSVGNLMIKYLSLNGWYDIVRASATVIKQFEFFFLATFTPNWIRSLFFNLIRVCFGRTYTNC